MKFLFDLFPVILFFAAFKLSDIFVATGVAIAATFAQIAWVWSTHRKVDTMLWVSLAVITIFGGMTLIFHNETFIKWKPSVLYWAMGLSLWLSPLLFGKNLLRVLLGEQMQLPDRVWHRLNFAWVAFFALMGLLNLWVAYHFSTDGWVNFKLFGGIGLMLLFTLAQGLYLSRHLKHETPATPPADPR